MHTAPARSIAPMSSVPATALSHSLSHTCQCCSAYVPLRWAAYAVLLLPVFCLQCNHKHQCFTCEPNGACSPLRHHQRLVVSQHGTLQGRHQMKAEIYARGPITCGIMATAGLDAYTGGCAWLLLLLAQQIWLSKCALFCVCSAVAERDVEQEA
jgi:hypothetical protein